MSHQYLTRSPYFKNSVTKNFKKKKCRWNLRMNLWGIRQRKFMCCLKWLRHHGWSSNAHDIFSYLLCLPALTNFCGDTSLVLANAISYFELKQCKGCVQLCDLSTSQAYLLQQYYYYQSLSSNTLYFALP